MVFNKTHSFKLDPRKAAKHTLKNALTTSSNIAKIAINLQVIINFAISESTFNIYYMEK